jgi:D-alanyl-D-alanine-carboxypeptidase/D-alanyl-D-alanine-endopeptidase
MKSLFTVIFLLVSVNLATAQNISMPIDTDTLIRGMGQRFVKDPESEGLSVGLFFHGKSYSYHFGTVKHGESILPDNNTQYELGSISKTFIGYLLAKAIVEKKVKADDDIRKYLDDGYPNLEFEGHPVTMIELANWTSGLPDNLPPLPPAVTNLKGDSLWFAAERFNDQVTSRDFIDALHQVKLDTIPGFKVRHSNAAVQLLAYALEKVYGDTYDKLVAQYIFKPLHMDHTVFLAARSSNTLANGYNEKATAMPHFDAPAQSASAGISSTTSDMLKYLKFLLNKSDSAVVLSERKTVSVDIYGIAVNWLIYRYDDGYSQVWSDGSTLGFYNFLIVYPELDCGIILLSNEASASSYGRLAGFADNIFQKLKTAKP